MAVKLGSTESVAELCWDIYWFLIDRSVSLSSCSEAVLVAVIGGKGGEGAIVMEAGRAVVENHEVDSWVMTSLLSLPLRPLW